jgi:hypothetical protein
LPAFSFPDGKPLTPKIFIETAKDLLKKTNMGDCPPVQRAFFMCCNSRSSGKLNFATDHEIMIWVRWSSNSYKAYTTHLKHEAKLSIFRKFVKIYDL